jgi:hypothetical protein
LVHKDLGFVEGFSGLGEDPGSDGGHGIGPGAEDDKAWIMERVVGLDDDAPEKEIFAWRFGGWEGFWFH